MTPQQIAANALRDFEGLINWMYLDTVGLVTVGIGDMLPNVKEAQALPFTNPISRQAETPQLIAADYKRVQGMTKGRVALAYKSPTSPLLSDEDAISGCVSYLTNMKGSLRNLWPHFDTFPDPAQAALYEMVYQFGPGGLAKFKHMGEDVARGDWPGAAAECQIKGEEFARRNAWRKARFLEAVNGNKLENPIPRTEGST